MSSKVTQKEVYVRSDYSVNDTPGKPVRDRRQVVNGRIRRGEGLCRLNRTAYRRRNVVERCFNRLKHNKALATRYDKRARHYEAPVTIACLRQWLP